jgi:hypothetical protein
MRNKNLLTRGLLGFVGLFVLCSASWASSPENLKDARAHEKKAFEFIKLEDWCAATNSFLDAYEKAPIEDYLFNAAKAMRLAGDRTQAMQLNMELIVKFRNSSLISEVNQNNKELSDEMTQKGPGLSCPRETATPAVTPTPPNATTDTAPPSPAPTQTSILMPSPATQDSPSLPPQAPVSMTSQQAMTLGVFIAGSVLTAAGAYGMYWGGSSYSLGHEIHDDLNDETANATRTNADIELISKEYDLQKEAWEKRDMPIMIVGTGALIVGLTGLGLGSWWHLSEDQE